MTRSTAKTKLIKQAQKRFPNDIIKPCGKRESLWESFTEYEKEDGTTELVLWFNVGNATFAENIIFKRVSAVSMVVTPQRMFG